MIKKLFKAIFVLQEVSNEERHKQGLERLGKGYFNSYRLNPYNPLSYIIALITLIIAIILYGFMGVWEKSDGNPFKWN